MIPLNLANGLVLPDATKLVEQKFTSFRWGWYDGVVTPSDRIEPVDFAITVAMNSRATAGRMAEFMKVAGAVEVWLQKIPVDLCLADVDDGSCDWDAVQGMFEAACAAPGTKLSVASKILHRKRPHLVPILDRVVVDRHYWLALTGFPSSTQPPAWFDASWLKRGSWSDPTMYMRVMRSEIRNNQANLVALRLALAGKVPSSISDVRLVEAALYWHLVTS